MIIVCHGTDAFRIRTAADAEARATGVAPVRVSLADPAGREELERVLKYPSFLQEHRTVIASDAVADPELPDRLAASDAAALHDTTVIVCVLVPPKPGPGANDLVAALSRQAVRVHECPQLTGDAGAAWFTEYCAGQGWTVEPAAFRALCARVGDDAWALAAEAEKLAAYGEGHISAAAVRVLTPESPEQDQWALSNALAAHDKRRTLAALFERVRAGTPEPLMLGALAGSLRTLLMIRDLADHGRTAAAIAREAGLHPYVVAKSLAGARAYDAGALRRALQRTAELDRAAKAGESDTVDGLYDIVLGLA